MAVRKRTAEMLESSAGIFCLQETQRAYIQPEHSQVPIRNDFGHGQLIMVRKGVRHKWTYQDGPPIISILWQLNSLNNMFAK